MPFKIKITANKNEEFQNKLVFWACNSTLTNQRPEGTQMRVVATELVMHITLEYKVKEKGKRRDQWLFSSVNPLHKLKTLCIDGKMSLKSSLKRSVSYLEMKKKSLLIFARQISSIRVLIFNQCVPKKNWMEAEGLLSSQQLTPE